MKIIIIVAYSKNRVIGKDNKLLWHLTDDMKFFKKMTQNQTVLMGKNTYWSLPEKFRPLPNRNNIVLTTKPFENTFENLMVFNNIENTLNTLKNEGLEQLFVIGGSQIYEAFLPFADEILATEVDAIIEGDAYFPIFDESEFHKEILQKFQKNESNDFDFEIISYKRKLRL
jgi:dihydrofolate reductase